MFEELYKALLEFWQGPVFKFGTNIKPYVNNILKCSGLYEDVHAIYHVKYNECDLISVETDKQNYDNIIVNKMFICGELRTSFIYINLDYKTTGEIFRAIAYSILEVYFSKYIPKDHECNNVIKVESVAFFVMYINIINSVIGYNTVSKDDIIAQYWDSIMSFAKSNRFFEVTKYYTTFNKEKVYKMIMTNEYSWNSDKDMIRDLFDNSMILTMEDIWQQKEK